MDPTVLSRGPLSGCRIVEVASIGPGPFGAMLLADLGADVVRVERPDEYEGDDSRRFEVMLRSRRRIPANLKDAADIEDVLRLVDEADVLIEGFRPGVMERLGLGPDTCLRRNQRLVYARMTGWGQDGELSGEAGHDINYISVGGSLAHLPSADGIPRAPLNLIGDFGAGGTMLALGVLAAVLEARLSGLGQVVDVSMVDGTAALMSMFHGYGAKKDTAGGRDPFAALSGAPFYRVYQCADQKFVSVGAAEPQFFRRLVEFLELTHEDAFAEQWDVSQWAEMEEQIASRIAKRSRDEWTQLAAGRDVCLTPVLTMQEAPDHPHLRTRGTFIQLDGVTQPGPPVRFSRTPPVSPRSPVAGRSALDEVLHDWRSLRSVEAGHGSQANEGSSSA